jgi:hypothetical protein
MSRRLGRNNRPALADRKARADARQELAAKRSPAEQLARLDAKGLTALKERARLADRLARKGENKTVKVPAEAFQAQPVPQGKAQKAPKAS